MSSLRLYQVDAFSSVPFGGNPAAVVLTDSKRPLSDSTMQQIAAEMNLAETAFVEVGDDPNGTRFGLRWFTPTQEVPLCGHATLGSAAALILGEKNPGAELSFQTRVSGVLTVSRATPEESAALQALAAGSSATGTPSSSPSQAKSPRRADLRMRLPHLDPTDPLPSGLTPSSPLVTAAAGGLPVKYLSFSAPVKYLVIELDGSDPRATPEALAALTQDFGKLKASAGESGLEAGALTGVIVALIGPTGGAGAPHVVSRFFAPWAGIDEDPVTGSAHAVLAPLVSRRIGIPPGALIAARQLSARRGDLVLRQVAAEAAGGAAAAVEVVGSAVLVLAGEIWTE